MSNNANQPLDPYRSPAVDAIVIDDPERPLTPAERRVLELYYRHRDRPFTTGGLIRRMLPGWFFSATMFSVLMILIVAAYSIVPVGRIGLQMLLIGGGSFLAGVITRDVGVARHVVRMWPVLREVFDWKKVEARLGKP